MKGWLVVNGYLQTEKFDEIYRWLESAAKKQNIVLERVTNDWLDATVPIHKKKMSWKEKPEFVLFWDKDVKLAQMLEQEGLRVLNCAKAVEICDDKALTFLKLKNTEIKMPKTFMAPMTFEKEYKNYNFLERIAEDIGYPMIIKENKGSFGAQVYLIKNYYEGLEKIKEIGHCDFIMQEFVESSKGRDVRIYVVGNQVVTAMERHNRNDFRANITNGGTMSPYEPTKAQKEMAIHVCQELELDFAGVDILFGEKEEPVLCEVNSNAHFKNVFDCTGVNVADCIMEYIKKKIQQ